MLQTSFAGKFLKISHKGMLYILFPVSIVVRLMVALHGIHGTDILFHISGARKVLEGGLLYRDTKPPLYYVYPPLYAYFQAFSILLLGDNLIGYKAFPLIFDVGVAWLLYHLSKKVYNERMGKMVAVFYLFYPLTIFSSSWYGLFDSIPQFFMLLALYLFIKERFWGSSISLAIGIMLKIFPGVILLPILISLWKKGGRKRLAKYIILVATIVFLIELPFMVLCFDEWFFYNFKFQLARASPSLSLWWALGLEQNLSLVPQVISFIVICYLMFRARKMETSTFLHGATITMLAFVTFNKFVYPHYTLWGVPLLLIYFAKDWKPDKQGLIPPVYLTVLLLCSLAYWKWYNIVGLTRLLALIYQVFTIALLFLISYRYWKEEVKE